MSRHRRRDRDRIDSWVLQNVCVVRGRFDFRVTAPGKGEAILPEVRDGNQLGFRSLDEIADEIRTPVPVANNTDTNQFEPPVRTKSRISAIETCRDSTFPTTLRLLAI